MDLAVKVDHLVCSGDMDDAYAALVAVARGGGATIEELEAAATRIAVTQVLEAYDTVPEDLLSRHPAIPRARGILPDRGSGEIPRGLRGRRHRADGRPATPSLSPGRNKQDLLTSPLSRSLLPSGINGRTPHQYLLGLPSSHKKMMAWLHGGEDSESEGKLGSWSRTTC